MMNKENFGVYLVGGAVRDTLLDKEPRDRDYVVTGATPEFMLSYGFKQVGEDFPVFLHPTTGEEYALARKERKAGNKHTDFDFIADTTVTIEEDLARRDLTINAMAIRAKTKVLNPEFSYDDPDIYFDILIDPFNGKQDLKNKIIRHTSEAFKEDPLRVLRVARFMSKFPRFELAENTKEFMRSMVENGDLNHLTKERVWLETQKAFAEEKPSIYFKTLAEIGALKDTFPELHQAYQEKAESTTFDRAMFSLNKVSYEIQNGFIYSDLNEEDKEAILFAALYENLKIDETIQKVRLPNKAVELQDVVYQLTQLVSTDYSAKDLINLFDKIDVSRKTDRALMALKIVEKDYNHLKHQMDTYLVQDVQEIIKEGYQGKEIRDKLRERRLMAMEVNEEIVKQNRGFLKLNFG